MHNDFLARELRRGAARRGDRACLAAARTRDFRRQLGLLRIERRQARPRGLQRGLRLVALGAIIIGLDFGDQIACMDSLVVGDRQVPDIALLARADLRHVAADIGIVGPRVETGRVTLVPRDYEHRRRD